AGAQRFGVAGLLVGPVAVVAIVDEDLQPELSRDVQRGVGGAVVDEDHEVDRVFRQLLVGHAQRPARVVGGHHDDDFRRARLAHARLAPTTNWYARRPGIPR